MNTPILQTKLYAPQPQPDLVLRPRLRDRLNVGLFRPLSFVCAPAGYGKTTLVADWISNVDRKIAWLSLDELDNESERYFTYIVAAIRTVFPIFGEGTSALLNSAQPQSLDLLVATFINEVAALDSPLILVLDDFHVLTEPTIHAGLERMLPYLPANFHLVVTSRSEPNINLARLRVRNQVNEVRVHELRFTLDEAVEFVNQRMGLKLSQEDVRELEARTEGWVAGLQLAALTLQNSPQALSTTTLIRSLSGSDRHLADYLSHEIVLAQPDDFQEFLLVTSVLNRICAELCNALLQRSDSQLILEELERRNLFVIPLDSERRWYRYHRLFGDLLEQMVEQQQGRDAVLRLHEQASTWFEQNGLLDEAIEHALLASRPDQAAMLMNSFVTELLVKQAAFAQVRRWLTKIPLATSKAYPLVLVAGLFSNLIAHNLVGAEPYLNALREASDLPDVAYGLLAVAEANLLRINGDVAGAKELLRKTLHTISEDEHVASIMIRAQMAVALADEEDLHGAYQLFTEASHLGRMAGDLYSELASMRWAGGMLHSLGELKRTKQLLDEALDIAVRPDRPPFPVAGEIHIGLSQLYYEWNQLDKARYHCTIGLKLAEQAGIGDTLVGAYHRQIELALVDNDVEAANQALSKLKEMTQLVSTIHDPAFGYDMVSLLETRLFIQTGELARAAEWIRATPVDLEQMPSRVNSIRTIHIAYWITKAWIEQDPGKLESIEPLLTYLIHLADERGMKGQAIWLRCLNAIRLKLCGCTAQAVESFSSALAMGQEEGYIRTFVDLGAALHELLLLAKDEGILPEYVNTLLTAFMQQEQLAEAASHTQTVTGHNDNNRRAAAPANPLLEPLTSREEEILSLVAAGLTNQQIAEDRIISIGTVKRHISNIFAKLGASHRAQAIALAKEFGLLK
ncbi:MAG: LuxR C-terminal-related transcriptional regulator [Chloroflexota bacterium]